MTEYHYTECGLSNVFVKGLEVQRDEELSLHPRNSLDPTGVARDQEILKRRSASFKMRSDVSGRPAHGDDSNEQNNESSFDPDVSVNIVAIRRLHACISLALMLRDFSVSGKEISFIRNMMGLSPSGLASIIYCDVDVLRKWEASKATIEPGFEILLRLLTVEHLHSFFYPDGQIRRFSVLEVSKMIGPRPRDIVDKIVVKLVGRDYEVERF